MHDLTERMRVWSHQRHCLGKRGERADDVIKAVIGVYSSHPTAALSLWARLRSIDAESFLQVDADKLALRVPAMRESVYWVPRGTAHLVMSATLPLPDDPYWQKRYSQTGRDIPAEMYEDWKTAVLDLTTTPHTAAEIKEAGVMPPEKTKFVLNRMAFEGHLLRVGAKSLRSNIISYVATAVWLQQPIQRDNQHEAAKWLAGEYLRAFGPARVRDFQWWSGLKVDAAKTAVFALETVDVGGGNLLLADDVDAFNAVQPFDEPVIDLLPKWDCSTMGYAPDGRERFVTRAWQNRIYGASGATGGNALGTVLLNGMAVGAWRSKFAGSKMKVSLDLFADVAGDVETAVKDQFNQMASFLGAKAVVFE